jgi:hypothetical protein
MLTVIAEFDELRYELRHNLLSAQNGTAVDVEDLTGDVA